MEVTGMAQGNEPTTETPDVQESASPAAPTEASQPDVSADAQSQAAPVVPEKPAYTPNLKFKTFDKEMEFDPLFKGVVKDADTEKKIRELHEKAYGLDYVKKNREELKSEVSELKSWKTQTEKNINQAIGFAQSDNLDDMDQFFKTFRIPLDKVMKYAVRLAERTPVEQQALDRHWQAQQGMSQYEQQLAELQERNQQLSVQQRTFELDQQLSRQDVVSVIEAFDSRVGQPGAFRAEVIRRGQLYAAQGQDISAEQAVSEVLRLIGPMHQPSATPAGAAAQGMAPQVSTPPQVVTPSQKPTIPNISGRGASVVKRKPKSLEDIKRLAEQAIAADG
jgi:hypothetical protein